MLRIVRLIFLIAMPFLSAGQVTRESSDIFVTPFGMDHGLRQSMVCEVMKDHNGLIWMTTGDGLHCFDGREFTSFRVLVDGVSSHSDNLQYSLTESIPGIITITSSSSILHFNITSGKFTVAFQRKGSYPFLLKSPVADKTLAWITQEKLCMVTRDKIIPQKIEFENGSGMPENFIPEHSCLAPGGALLIASQKGLLMLKPATDDKDAWWRAEWKSFPGIQSLVTDPEGRVFVLANGTIFQYLSNGSLSPYFDTRLTNQVTMFVDHTGNFWLMSPSKKKHYRLSNGVLHEIHFSVHDGKHVDSITPDIRSVFEDDDHNIWFGTDGDGVLLYSPQRVQFLRSDIGFTRCMAWFNEEIWAGTYKNGLWRFNSDLKAARRVQPGFIPEEAYYLDLAADHRGRLWVATQSGLRVLDKDHRIMLSRPINSRGAKWYIGESDTVLLFCDDKMHRFHAGDVPVYIDSRDFVQVSSFLQYQGYYWIGNQFGLYRAPITEGLKKDRIFGLSNQVTANGTFGLLVNAGNIWAATGNGIETFSATGARIPLTAGLLALQNEVIYTILPDNQGMIWFAGNRGIGCLDTKTSHIINFTSRNNLQSLEFNSNAFCRAPDGRLFFGGIRGINGFDPDWFSPAKRARKVSLLSLMVADRPFCEGVTPGSQDIILNRKSPHFGGKVFCSDYTNAGSQLFSFLLEGYQNDWSKPSPNSEFSYRDLPPGKFKLLVRCADPWQNWSEAAVVVTVTLHPPFWKTGWFLILLMLTTTALTAYLARRINSMRFKRKIQALEQQNVLEKERLRIAKDMHDDLGASLTRISILSEMAKKQQDDPQKIRQVIGQISDISGSVVDEMSEIIWALNPRNDTFDSFAAYIRQYASSYLESAGIEGSVNFPDKVPSSLMSSEQRRNLFLIVKEALHNVVKHSGAKNVGLELRFNEPILQITITDDGRGFTVEKAQGMGNGLLNMRKRTEEHGGRFEISSQSGAGTSIRITVNIPAHEISH